eukprot:scaffold11849_cov66-Phaeocystis_antarctica.AAC.5
MEIKFISVRPLMSEYKNGDPMKSYGAKKPSGHDCAAPDEASSDDASPAPGVQPLTSETPFDAHPSELHARASSSQ